MISLLPSLLLVAIPMALVLLGMRFMNRRTASAGRFVRRWIVSDAVLALLVAASAVLLGLAGWATYEDLRERHAIVAVSPSMEESLRLARALRVVTERHHPRIRMTVLAMDGAAGKTGWLEKGVVGLAITPTDLPPGPKTRRITTLVANSQPAVLVARTDEDERVVYGVTEVMMERRAELLSAMSAGSAAGPGASIVAAGAKANSNIPLHPGALQFYAQTPLVWRHAGTITLVTAALGSLGLVRWRWKLRTQRNGLSRAAAALGE
ncbi:MAG: hypothetical protein FJW39_29875 [Acidobacteria bacterium]|nr:hypothetical protein [Acidobacteriota bacterium]